MIVAAQTCVNHQQTTPTQQPGVSGGGGGDLQTVVAALQQAISALQAAIDAFAGARSIGASGGGPMIPSPAGSFSVPDPDPTTAPAPAPAAAPAREPAPAPAPAPTAAARVAPASTSDAALTAQLDDYLKGSPLAGHGKDFVAAGKKHGIDPRLGVAIAKIESGLGKHLFKPHNAWGFGSYSWDSFSEGIDTVYSRLKKNYVDGGLGLGKLTSVKAIGEVYCPVGAANDINGTNHHWIPTVTSVLQKLGGNPADVRWNGS